MDCQFNSKQSRIDLRLMLILGMVCIFPILAIKAQLDYDNLIIGTNTIFRSTAAGNQFQDGLDAKTTNDYVRETNWQASNAVLQAAISSGSLPTNLVYEPVTNVANTIQTITYTGTTNITIDAASGAFWRVTMTNSVKFLTPSNLKVGTYIMCLYQGTNGNNVATWTNTFKWSGGTAPTITTNANSTNLISFVYDGTNMLGSAGLNYQ